MTRIESGALRLNLQPGDMQDVIGTALEQLGARAADHQIRVSVPENFPLVPMDFTLMVQVVVNAVKYSPRGSLIEVSAVLQEKFAHIEIADRGVGIPPAHLRRVFDKFYRVQRPESVSGTGLGLSISKGIVEVHYGSIDAHTRAGGGTIIHVDLPLYNMQEVAHE